MELNNGKFPWRLSQGPLDASNIRDKIRSFAKKVEEGNLILDRKVERLVDCLLFVNSWVFLQKLYKKTLKVNKSEEKLFKKWNQTWLLILRDFLTHQKEFYPVPPGWEK